MSTMYIPINQLRHHPNNPRKDFGDLTELAESIKTQGLIQPLLVTIAGYDNEDVANDYYVIAGNRRLEACKLAGVDTVHCEIADIDDETAVGIMLTENIVRQNLNTVEEANGFQLMLDMGKDEEQIAKETGFKKETVKLRTKLRNLNAENVMKACEAGATIYDLAAVADIEDEKEREKLLKKAGTREFNNALKALKDNEKQKERLIAIEEFMRDHEFEEYSKSVYDNGFRKLSVLDDEGNIIGQLGFVKEIASYRTWGNDMPSEDMIEKGKKYYYVKDNWGVDVFTDVTQEELDQKLADEVERNREQEKRDKLESEINSINKRHRELRYDFVAGFTNFKKKQKELKAFWLTAMDKAISMLSYDESNVKIRYNELMDAASNIGATPDHALLYKAYAILEGERYLATKWNGDLKASVPTKCDCPRLDALYTHLKALGYEMSTEEEELQNGIHSLYYKEPEYDPDEDDGAFGCEPEAEDDEDIA